MPKRLTIYILEDEKQECEALKQEILRHEDSLELFGISGDSAVAIENIRVLIPDIVILDLELHKGGGNGIVFLSELDELSLSFRPYILVTTNNTSEVTLEHVRELGADFILTKYENNYSAKYVINFILAMRKALQSKLAEIGEENIVSPDQEKRLLYQRIRHELDLIGVSPKLKGYDYLVDAIYYYIVRPQARISQLLADKYHKTDTSIERAMQNAINHTWRFADPNDLLTNYTSHIRADKGVPTLVEFLAYYARKIGTSV